MRSDGLDEPDFLRPLHRKRSREACAKAIRRFSEIEISRIPGRSLFATALSASAAYAEHLSIAVVGPMTGQLAPIGDQFKQGANAAAAAINEKEAVSAARRSKIVVEGGVCDQTGRVRHNRIAAAGISSSMVTPAPGSTIPASRHTERHRHDHAGFVQPELKPEAAFEGVADDHRLNASRRRR